MTENPCPICKGTAQIEVVVGGDPRAVLVTCRMCGLFLVNRSWLDLFREMADRNLLPYLSAHIRQNSSLQQTFQLDPKNWEQLAILHKATPVPRKIDRLLSLIAQRTDPPGSEVSFVDSDAPLVDAADIGELVYLLRQIHELGYIELELTSTSCRCVMKASGWEYIHEQTVAGSPGRCFVAMSFHPSLEDAWANGFYPALKDDCKLDPVRMDKEQHNEKICDKIIAEIRLSQFLVADFTFHRGGVYFEAGFGLGLDRPVIWTCREDEFTNEKVHFDTRQYNHIVWTTPADLREKLRNRVLATIQKTA